MHTEPEPSGGPPLGARLRPAGPRTLRLTWSPPPPQSLTHGRIQATYVRLADQITLTRSVRRPELVLLLKHLQPNTAYSVPMSACNRAGQDPASSPVTATTEEGVPEVAPRQLTCRVVSPSSIGLSCLWLAGGARARSRPTWTWPNCAVCCRSQSTSYW